MKIEISKIKVSDRIRKDPGDINELANDIKENGLISPIAVTQDMELLAGWRRLSACKQLGWTEIEANVMTVEDALSKLKIEISENENRKEFTFSERTRWMDILKNELRKVAEENQKKGTSVPHGTQVGRVDEQVGKLTGLGGKNNVYKAEYIIQHATPEMIKALDDEQLSINAAYTALKKANEEKQKEIDRLQSENEDLTSANEMFEADEEAASDKIDSLELELQKWRTRANSFEDMMDKTDNSELRKAASDAKLQMQDLEEQKIAAEMLAEQRLQEISREKTKVQMVVSSFDAYKKEMAEKMSEAANSRSKEYVAGVEMIIALVNHLASVDTSDWSDTERKAVINAFNKASSTIQSVTKQLSKSAA